MDRLTAKYPFRHGEIVMTKQDTQKILNRLAMYEDREEEIGLLKNEICHTRCKYRDDEYASMKDIEKYCESCVVRKI